MNQSCNPTNGYNNDKDLLVQRPMAPSPSSWTSGPFLFIIKCSPVKISNILDNQNGLEWDDKQHMQQNLKSATKESQFSSEQYPTIPETKKAI